MARKTTRKTTSAKRSTRKSGSSSRKKTTTKKAGRSPRITSNQAKGFGSFLKEMYSDE